MKEFQIICMVSPNMPVPALIWDLILSDNPETIARLEMQFGTRQSIEVDRLIENSVWSSSPSVGHLVGHMGSEQERLAAIRAALSSTLSIF